MIPNECDDVWVTEHEDGTLSWEWRGNYGYALVQREVLEGLLRQVSDRHNRAVLVKKACIKAVEDQYRIGDATLYDKILDALEDISVW